ncbi:PREDICTED: uncharacterized protein C6orf136 homolog [Nanorana parkeri]|uniref:uncharacterized protein C6orf136 homolog n=1 Tax=Nanorana parkeri TaxID=125878 RepID=UPI000853FB2F|nr:PREDICTED: uncharacterized protein C6orf136 homolog [Nanorana parkeri]
MALCVRRLRGVPGLGRSGVRGAGLAAGKLREGSRVRDVILFRELRPSPGISTPVRPPTAIALSPRSKPVGIRLCSAPSEQDRAVQHLQDIVIQNKLPPKPVSQFFHHAEPSDSFPPDRECGHLSSAQLDCFRSLFEPGVCRTPYQALAFPTPAAQEGLLKFTLSAKTAGGQATGSEQPSMEEHLAVMHEKLREELPKFLWKPANASLYRKDVEFISRAFHVHLRGLIKYQLFLTFTRLLLLSYYSNSHVSVLKLTSHPETNSIHARWSFTGLPLHCLLIYILKSDKTELYRTYDAFSIFQLAPDGLIGLHKVERVMPSSPLTVTKKTVLAAALLALGLGPDRPALNLLSTPKLPDKL